MKTKRLILLTVLILMMSLIFYMSHQPAEESSGMSREVCRVICQIFVSDYEALSAAEQEKMIDAIHFWVRKGAHCTEYMVLGVLMYLNIAAYVNRRRLAVWTSILAGILYAVSDEVHQYFIPGRSCQLTDVCIDSLGVLTGVTISWLIGRQMLMRSKTAGR